jgi:hypothetical protein
MEGAFLQQIQVELLMTRCSTLSPLQQSAFEWMQDRIVLLHYPISRQHCNIVTDVTSLGICAKYFAAS